MPLPIERLKYGSQIRGERSVSEHIPYTCHLNRHTVATRQGHLLQVLRVEGLPFETFDQGDLNHFFHLRNELFQSLCDPRFALVYTCIRRRIPSIAPERFDNPFCDQLEEAWTSKLAEYRSFAVEHYLTVIRRPIPGAIGVIDSIRKAFSKTDPLVERQHLVDELKALHEATTALVNHLHAYGARRLQIVDREGGIPDSEPLRFLSYLINRDDRPVAVPRMEISHYLPTSRIAFGQDVAEIRGAERERVLAAILSVKEYPSGTFPGMLDTLLRSPHEFVLTQSFAFIDRQSAIKKFEHQGRRMDNTQDSAMSLRSDLMVAQDRAASGAIGFGEHHLTLMVTERTPESLADAVSELQADLLNQRIRAVREKLNLEPAFWAQLPGNFSYIARGSLISTENFGGLASFHTFPRGQASGNYWGRCATTFQTTSGTPYHFSLHQKDVGNGFVIGPIGSGKTVFSCFLLAQAQRFSPRCVYFDKDRGAELTLRAMGGTYSEIRPGRCGLGNPFALPDTPKNREFLRQLVGVLVRSNGRDAVSSRDQRIIAEAIDASYASEPYLRKLSSVQELLRGHERAGEGSLADRIAAWHGTGEHAWVFDGEPLDLEASVLGFDLTFVLSRPALRTPVLLYLFHRVDLLLDGSPTLMFIDEAWKALEDPIFAPIINDWLLTGRKRNLALWFAAQAAQHLLESRIRSALLECTASQIYFPNHRGNASEYCEGLGLSAREFEIVRRSDAASRIFLIKHGLDSVVASLNLDGMDDLIAILSGRESTVKLLDQIRKEVGDDPKDWMPIFHERRDR